MSENLSSKNLFHFTDKDILKSILKDGFYALYCKEQILSTVFNKNLAAQYIPMVSFCNIPLTMVKSHCSLYGSYGIGLTKQWALRNRINPVLYSYRNSALMKTYSASQKEYEELVKEGLNNKAQKVFINNFIKSVIYLKPLEGRNKKGKPTFFYDEKEWRYVPSLANMSNIMLSHRKIVAGDVDFRFPNREKVKIKINSVRQLNTRILHHGIRHFEAYRLKFDLNDIRFIILKNSREVPTMIKFLLKNINSKIKVDTLIPKIITLEQLKEDF